MADLPAGRSRTLLFLVPVVLCLAALLGAASADALPAGNLLVNPAAEGPPSKVGELFEPPSGWTQTAPVDPDIQSAYDSCYGGSDSERDAVDSEVGEAIGGGARLFFAGDNERSELVQEILVGAEAAGHPLLLGGYFGGFSDQEDYAYLSASFYKDGAFPVVLGSVATAPVTAADRGDVTELLRREASGTVPAGTTRIRFVLSQIREDGADDDGYADSLFATFDPTAPAPPAASGDATCPLKAAAPAPTPTPGPSPSPPSPPAPPAAAPAVTITSGPDRETASSKAVFTFTGTPGGSFECALDDGAWRPCASGGDFGPVQPGDHRFQVREKLGGQTSAPASYRWTVDLPRQCVLRVARARVFVYSAKEEARLVIHYTSYRPAQVGVSYQLKGSKGGLSLGSAKGRFSKAGVFRLPVGLNEAEIAKVRSATSFKVRFQIAGTPSSCGRFYTRRLTIPRKVSGQTVWFQSDSNFAP